MMINCSIQLINAVDSQVTVTTVWRKNGVMITSSASRRVLDAILGNSSLYLSQVIFRPFELESDDGVYSCEVAVSSEEYGYVLDTGQHSDNVSLVAAGDYYYVHIHT